MTLGLFSQSYMNPPTFSLSFNVSSGPPTYITCYINDSPVHDDSLERMIVNGSGSVTGVSVVITGNQTGTYSCSVSNDRVLDGGIDGVTATNSTTTLTINSKESIYYHHHHHHHHHYDYYYSTGSTAPINLNAIRINTGLRHVRLSWSPVPGATGYEVYQMGNSMYNSIANTTGTTVDVTSGLFRDYTYTFDVIAYGNTTLPSVPASTSITISKH